MTKKLFTIYDSKAETYVAPFCLLSRGEAIRAFTDTVNDQSIPPGKYPEDFSLFELGTFDETNCKFVLYSTPTSLGVGVEFVKQRPSLALDS